ncbi:hypothetical protein U1Q18_050163 [Sarracenia purpurea var. burkii]
MMTLNLMVRSIITTIQPSTKESIFRRFKTGEYIVKGRLITIKNGLAYHFNPLLEENYLKAIGISLDNAPVGETLHIQVEGVVEITNWGLAVNTNYYAGPAGQLMPSAPDGSTTQGVTQSVGLSLTPEKLNLDFSTTVLRLVLPLGKLVALTSTGFVLADNGDITKEAMGVALTAGTVGQQMMVAIAGRLTIAGSSFAKGTRYYLEKGVVQPLPRHQSNVAGKNQPVHWESIVNYLHSHRVW